MIGTEPLILFGIILALALNFVNGLNDASHSIATVVATRALTPAKAVLLTGLCNFAGPYLFTTAVAATIGTAVVTPAGLTPLSIIVAMATKAMRVVARSSRRRLCLFICRIRSFGRIKCLCLFAPIGAEPPCHKAQNLCFIAHDPHLSARAPRARRQLRRPGRLSSWGLSRCRSVRPTAG